MSHRRPVIKLFTLGGTIASIPDSGGRNAVPKLSSEDLLSSIPHVHDFADFRPTAFRRSASVDITPEDIVELARLIETEANTVDGIVITQGTDTLEESSYLLDLLLTTDVPVAMTGAMRHSGIPGADGAANLLAAIQVALDPAARALGPLVVFADEIHLARYVRKVHTSSVAAFASPNAGPVGWVNEGRVRIPLLPTHRDHPVDLAQLPDRLPTIGVAKVGLGSGPLLPEHVTGFDGIVIDGLGGGHVPARMVASLEAIHRRIPVVLASRTGAGELYESTYAYPGSESDLLGRGIVSAGSLDTLKTRMLLMLLLAVGHDRNSIDQAFRKTSGEDSSPASNTTPH